MKRLLSVIHVYLSVLDILLLIRIERLAQRIEFATGADCFEATRLLSLLTALAMFGQTAIVLTLPSRLSRLLTVVPGILLTACALYRVFWPVSHDWIRTLCAEGFHNPLKSYPPMVIHRIAYLLLVVTVVPLTTPILPIAWPCDLICLSALLTTYLDSSNPLPPSQRREKRAQRAPAHGPAPTDPSPRAFQTGLRCLCGTSRPPQTETPATSPGLCPGGLRNSLYPLSPQAQVLLRPLPVPPVSGCQPPLLHQTDPGAGNRQAHPCHLPGLITWTEF